MTLNITEWNDHLIANDSNFGMELLVQSDRMKSVVLPQFNTMLHVTTGICITPEKGLFNGYDVKGVATRIIAFVLKGMSDDDERKPRRWMRYLETISSREPA